MHLLFRVVYAAHANGTHHKLALNALRHLQSGDAEGWRRMILEDVATYLDGAKAPDDQFKDFKNHVLHVRDGYWGGAVDKVDSWYGQLVTALGAQRWSEAVFAAGILTHYLTDPIHPFHTAQSEAENNIHRAAEWSISRSYNDLLKIGEAGPPALELTVGTGPGWLRDLVCRGAEIANANYERLIAHYDIHRGVVDPPAGLDAIARGVVADLLVYAARACAAVLDRAFAEAKVSPPAVNLAVDTVLATLKIPMKVLAKRMTDAGDRKLVEAMYDELRATGRVEQNLPADDRMVRDLHRTEVLGRQSAQREQQRAALVGRNIPAASPLKSSGATTAPPAARTVSAPSPQPAAGPVQAVAIPAAPPAQPPAAAPPPTPQAVPATSAANAVRPAGEAPVAARPQLVASAHDVPAAKSASPAQQSTAPSTASVPQVAEVAPQVAATSASLAQRLSPTAVSVPTIGRGAPIYLAAGDDLEKAPSIGPKGAERFASIGIRTVAQFLSADPTELATRFGVRPVTAQVITAWQDQAKLVMRVPGLRGTHAQLLVGAGYRTVDAIAEARPDRLCAAVLAFAISPDGQRLLRDGTPPDVEKIKGWIDSALAVRAA